jgi:uncharacterized protein YjeT (DUF2065 family)
MKKLLSLILGFLMIAGFLPTFAPTAAAAAASDFSDLPASSHYTYAVGSDSG